MKAEPGTHRARSGMGAMLLIAGGLVGSSSSTLGAPSPDMASAPAKTQQGAPRRAILMDVSLKNPNSGRLVLKVVMRYEGDKEVPIYQSSLPWGNTYSLLLVAVKADAMATPVDRSYPIDDPGPAKIAVKPGQTLVGEIDLTTRFPDLRRAVQQRDVIVFWSYEFRPIEGASFPRVGGWLMLPKATRRQ